MLDLRRQILEEFADVDRIEDRIADAFAWVRDRAASARRLGFNVRNWDALGATEKQQRIAALVRGHHFWWLSLTAGEKLLYAENKRTEHKTWWKSLSSYTRMTLIKNIANGRRRWFAENPDHIKALTIGHRNWWSGLSENERKSRMTKVSSTSPMHKGIRWDTEPLLGKVPDTVLAVKYGVDKSAVAYARRQRGIVAAKRRVSK